MKFWKKYKNRKQLKQKLEKARFINFYDNKIDFINSDKFTERLNEYNELKKEYELL